MATTAAGTGSRAVGWPVGAIASATIAPELPPTSTYTDLVGEWVTALDTVSGTLLR